MGVRVLPDKILRLKNISKTYHQQDASLTLLKDINLTIHPGEFVCIVGVPGSGKSTLLRMLAGLDKSFSGDISQSGKSIAGAGVNCGIVFNEPRLLPWFTLSENIALALQSSDLNSQAKRERLEKSRELLGLKNVDHAHPHQVSDDILQRVAIARALVNRPDIVVFDEPFRGLNAMARAQLQQDLQDIWKQEKNTMIFVTHDVEEAVFLADRIVIMEPNPGRIKRILVGLESFPRDRTSVAFNAIKRLAYAEIGGHDQGKNPYQTYVDFNRLAEVRLSW